MNLIASHIEHTNKYLLRPVYSMYVHVQCTCITQKYLEDSVYSYTVTSLCESNLERYLQSLPTGSPLQFVQVTSRFCHEILRGLTYLHQHGIYHGSLKVHAVMYACNSTKLTCACRFAHHVIRQQSE